MTESGAKLILTSATVCCAWVLIALPRPILPRETPSLALDRTEAAQAIKNDEALAALAPSGPEVDSLRELWLAQGLEEVSEGEMVETLQENKFRRIRSGRAARAVARVHGEAALDALRAQASFAFEEALERGDQDDGVLGAFLGVLEKYDAIVDGVRVAPRLCIRALYKARWNAILRRPLTEGFSEIERRAYWGWLALHGKGTLPSTRASALEQYAIYGGSDVEEGRAVLAYWQGAPTRAATLFRAEYDRTNRLRLRNFSRGALQSSQR